MSKEEKSEVSKKGGNKTYELGVGVHSLTKEEKSEVSKKGGNKVKELGLGVCGLTPEQRRVIVKKTNSQRWECCETGYVSTAAGVVTYQKARGIDTSKNNRRRIA
jgi:general stress protein YciG